MNTRARAKSRSLAMSASVGGALRADGVAPEERLKSERVYRDLRRRIRELDLQPGSQLDKNEIAIEYGVSRAPVSEAIARLAVEGLADVFPQSGSFVAPIRLQDVRESLLIRIGLEVEAVRRAALLRNEQFFERLEDNLNQQSAAIARNDAAQLDDLDRAFHGIILSAVNSPSVARMVDRARAILDRPRFFAVPDEGRPQDALAEHRRIVDAVRTGDVELAGATMRVHLTMVSQAIERIIVQMQTAAEQPVVKRH
jgi:GntR family transcriptional regulator, rspAB operon transcriptional repressor